jgi:hypothetical protein
MTLVNYADLCLVPAKVASKFDVVMLKLRELKACSTLLDAYTSCPSLRSDLEDSAVEIKGLKHKLDHSSHYTVYPLHVKRVSLSRVSFSMLPKRTPS